MFFLSSHSLRAGDKYKYNQSKINRAENQEFLFLKQLMLERSSAVVKRFTYKPDQTGRILFKMHYTDRERETVLVYFPQYRFTNNPR